jgi:hypothetical protein
VRGNDPSPDKQEIDMTKLNNETRELIIDELESVSGGFIWGNVVWDAIKYESANGFIANAVKATGNTPGKA